VVVARGVVERGRQVGSAVALASEIEIVGYIVYWSPASIRWRLR
jgi:hypothetical protein